MTDYKKIREELYEKHSKTFEKLHMSEKNDEIARLTAEVAAFKAGNRDLQLHFDVLKADYDNLTAENERLMAELRTAADMNVVYEGRLQEKEAENERLRAALAAIEKLALQASIASCTCLTKTPDITFHNPGCRYVLLQYIIAQCEDARAALKEPST